VLHEARIMEINRMHLIFLVSNFTYFCERYGIYSLERFFAYSFAYQIVPLIEKLGLGRGTNYSAI
ncbi:MAG: hypothetical protein KJO29_02820, partial [Bacteroidia bacterium]|nr:hypothetical protein [Bacteroidia bacterium]